MTSKEPVAAVLEGWIPDRVPYAEFAVDFDTVERVLGRETYLRANAKSQIAFWEGRRDEVEQSWREDHIELRRRLPLGIVTFAMATWEDKYSLSGNSCARSLGVRRAAGPRHAPLECCVFRGRPTGVL